MRIGKKIILKGNAPLTAAVGSKEHEKTPKITEPYQRQIDRCLNCAKPASECKGNCF